MEILNELQEEMGSLEEGANHKVYWYKIGETLVIMVYGLLCGLQKMDDIHDWAKSAPSFMKAFAALAMALLLLLIVGCGRDNEQTDENLLSEYIMEENMHEQKQAAVILPVSIPQQEHTITMADLFASQPRHFTLEELLYDFDYMIDAMEYAFPYFGVVERRFDLDLRVLAQEIRETIVNYPYSLQEFAYELGISLEDMPVLDEHVLRSIIGGDFFSQFVPFAHAGTLWFSNADRYREEGSISAPATRIFFREQEALFRTLLEENHALFQFYFRNDPSIAYQLLEPPEPLPLVTTEIIEEGEIAYVRIGSLANPPIHFMRQLINFYETVQDYAHLIIDMRESGGGSGVISPSFIMYPLWYDRDNAQDMIMYAFFTNYDVARSLRQRLRLREQLGYSIEPDRILSLSEILEMNDLPYLNAQDAQFLPYGFRLNVNVNSINPNASRISVPRIPFEGQIWLLTSNRNYSASAVFANTAKGTGFATLVGEQVLGGLTATSPYYFSLPNTGIVIRWDRDYFTDQYGRSLLEFLPTPHYFNKEGMDALETTLSIINARNP